MTDREAIEELRRKDVGASKAQDAEQLAALWTEDCIALPPGLPPARGKSVVRAQLARMLEYQREMEIVEYEEVFEELEILGDTAIEWGRIRGAERPRAGGEIRRLEVKVSGCSSANRMEPGSCTARCSISDRWFNRLNPDAMFNFRQMVQPVEPGRQSMSSSSGDSRARMTS